MKKIFKSIGFFALLVAGLMIFAGCSKVPYEPQVKGGENTKVTLVEFADFQCPACGYYAPLVSAVSKEFGDDLKVEFYHFPLQMHINAVPAAVAAEAAGIQGKFWEMHDKLFEKQQEWQAEAKTDALFAAYAAEIGLDVEKFKTDMENPDLAKKVKTSYGIGASKGVSGTPTFFVNDEEIPLPPSEEAFIAVIRAYLNDNKETNESKPKS